MTARSYQQLFARDHCSIRRLMLGGAMLVTVAVGLVTPSASQADGCGTTERLAAHAGLSQNVRQIVLIEGRDPANFPVDDATGERLIAHAGLSPTGRSIVLREGRDPAHFSVIAIDC